jgi:hypothetical protein
MPHRILFDSAPAEGGGTATATAPAQAVASGDPPAPAKSPPPPPSKVEVDAAYLADVLKQNREMGERLTTFEDRLRAEKEAADEKHFRELADKDGAAKALEAQKESLRTELSTFRSKAERDIKAVEEKYRAEMNESLERLRGESGAKLQEAITERDAAKQEAESLRRDYLGAQLRAAVTDGMAGRSWLNEHAERQVRKELADRMEIHRDGRDGKITIREKGTNKPANEVIPALLDSDEFAHFQKPSTTGGTGATAAASRTATAAKPGVDQGHGDINDEIINDLKKHMDERREGAIGLRFHSNKQ